MVNKKNSKDLLNEELKRHKKLVEYTFYVGEDDDIVGNPEKANGKDLILGEEPEDEEQDTPNPDTEVGDEELGPPTDEPTEEPAGDDMAGDDMAGDDMAGDDMAGDDMTGAVGDTPPAEPGLDAAPAPAEDEIELDVTQLVQGTEEAKMSADMANQKMATLINQFNELNNKLNKLEDLDSKIEDLEQEIVKRNPTQVEKLEMRSLDSFPYNLKLTDYWADKESEGKVQATDTPVKTNTEKPEEYELTIKDIDNDYNQQMMPDTFNPNDEVDELEDFKFLK